MTISTQSLPFVAANNAFGDDDNYLTNGDFKIAQAGASFAGLAAFSAQYISDTAAFVNAAGTSIYTAAQVADHPILGAQGYSLKLTVTTADAAVAAADLVELQCKLEGNDVAQFLRDAAGASFAPFCIGFWMKHNIATGNVVIPVGIGSSNNDRNYCSSVSMPLANTWYYFVVPVISTGFTAGGTWNIAPPNANLSANIRFGFMAGTNFTGGTADQWNLGGAAVQYPAGGTNIMGTNGNTIQIADLKIQRGMVGTVYKRKSFQAQLAECQRYYWQTFNYGVVPATAVGIGTGELQFAIQNAGAVANFVSSIRHPVQMRAAPTVTTFNPSAANAQVRNVSDAADCSATAIANTNQQQIDRITYTGNAGAAFGELAAVHITANSRL